MLEPFKVEAIYSVEEKKILLTLHIRLIKMSVESFFEFFKELSSKYKSAVSSSTIGQDMQVSMFGVNIVLSVTQFIRMYEYLESFSKSLKKAIADKSIDYNYHSNGN